MDLGHRLRWGYAALVITGACYLEPSAWATNTFSSPGDWHSPGNWTPGPVPVDGEDVLINANVLLTNTTAVLANYVLSAGRTHTFGGTNTALIASNVTILGTMTHYTNSATTTNTSGQWVPDSRIDVRCTNLTVASGGLIHGDGRGYKAQSGPGAGILKTGGGFAGGGGYGGNGGYGSAAIDTGGVAYGSATLPFDPGSGGGRPEAGAGGGAIWIEAANHVLVNGTIRAAGGDGNGGAGASSGSGGGIYIHCLTLGGTNGTIAANAGINSLYGCAGGGRIAVDYDPTAQGVLNATAKPTITFAANAGPVAAVYTHPGRPGTLWFTDTGFFPSTNLQGGVIMIPGLSSWTATNVTVSQGVAVFTNGVHVTVTNLTLASGNNSGIEMTNADLTVVSNLIFSGGNSFLNGGLYIGNSNLTIQGVVRLSLTNSTFTLPGSLAISGTVAGLRVENRMPLNIGGSLNVSGGSNTIADTRIIGSLSINAGLLNLGTNASANGVSMEVVGNMTVTNAGKLYVYAGLTNPANPHGAEVSVTGSVIVTSNSWIYPISHPTNGGSAIFRMQNLTILHGTNAGFNAYAMGFGGKPTSGNTTNYGPGGGTINGGGWAGGGGYGGKGADGSTGVGGPTYGSATNPIDPGSAGGRVNDWGGGLVRIHTRGTLTLSGALLAEGRFWPAADGGGGGGGSGGSIFITCKGLAGANAKLSAKGGDARTSSSGGGGGGGRIAIWRVPVLETADTNSWTLNVNGGTAFSNGSPGSVYWGVVEMVVPPSISNSLVSGVTSNSANLNGYLSSTGTALTTVSVCWGTADGGTNGGIGWQNTNTFDGTQSARSFSTNVTLLANTLYYYRYLGANAGGDTWGDPAQIFATGDITVSATDPNAAEAGLDPATFTVSRPDWATNGPMTVLYAISGSASNGVDYALLSGEVSMAPGASNATVTVSPLADALPSEGTEEIILTLTGDAYMIGAMNSATATLADAAVDPTNTWSGSGNWTNAARWSSGHKPVDGQFVIVTGNVTLAESTANMGTLVISNATFTFTNWSTKLSAVDIRIGTNVTLTLPGAFIWNDTSNRVWIACTNLFLDSSSQIDVSQKGYQRDSGPGAGTLHTYYGGGGYGGMGGWNTPGGATYGSATNSSDPGSGGGGVSSTAGGGVVRIEASGHVVVNGRILSNGGPQGGGWACGSGGSVYLACRTFAGTNGTIAANGGASSATGGSGGGGRVGLVYDASAQAGLPQAVTGMVIAANQGYGVNAGQPGTLYLTDTNFFPRTPMQGGVLMIPDFTAWTVENLLVSNGQMTLPSGFQLSVTDTLLVTGNGGLRLTNSVATIANLTLSNAVYNTAVSYVHGGTGGAVTVTGNLTINQSTLHLVSTETNPMTTTVGGNFVLTNSSRLYVYGCSTNNTSQRGALVRVNGDLVVGGNAWIIPVSQPQNGGSPFFSVKNLTLLSTNSGFNANVTGFGPAEGPGRGQTPGGGWYGGGGYGGKGGSTVIFPVESGGITYGSSNAPVDPGSGGGRADAGAGGGSIQVHADSFATINGSLLANGGPGSGNAGGGGGSGGGIYLTCRRLRGTNGVLTAKGGQALTSEGPGGGGRIAIWRVNDDSTPGGWTVSAAGGTAGTTNGAPGTVVWGNLPTSGTIFMVH